VAKKKKAKTRRQAVRDVDRRLVPAWVWLTVGLVAGLGLAVVLTLTGIMPQPSRPEALRPVPADPEPASREEIAQEAGAAEEEWRPRYDFYTVLPEMEVVVPEAELRERAAEGPAAGADSAQYVLQVGSFREFADADRIKAQLALQGIVAHVRSVDINGTTWHRVRVGPYESSRRTDSVKRRLQADDFEVIVLTERP